jgi:prepilin-type N-terminal cleavage/methylation domain-containing protein/prepilin-type processing-associated H-X9-DG protein
MKHAKGFTLIELLVVIAIIALLLSIIMPALTKAKRQVQYVICRSNVKQFQMGANLYWQEYDYKPFVFRSDYMYINYISPFLEDVDAIRYCPRAAPKQGQENRYGLGNARTPWRWTYGMDEMGSYGFNSWLYKDYPENWLAPGNSAQHSYPSISRISTPSQVPVVGDAVWYDAAPYYGDLLPDNFDLYDGGGWYLESQITRFVIDRHDMRVNLSFVDGHVEGVRLEKLWTLSWHRSWVSNYDISLTGVPKQK